MSTAQLLLQVAARGTALLALTLLAGLLFRRASAATRHLIWTGGLMVSLVVPLISLPEPALPVLPALPSVASTPTSESVAPPGVQHSGAGAPERWSGSLTNQASENAGRLTSHVSPLTADVSRLPSPDRPPVSPSPLVKDWPRLLAFIWLAGILVAGLRLVVGRIGVARLAQRSVPVSSPEWKETIRGLRATNAVRRPVRFLESAEVVTPCTWGTLEPTVLLPAVGADWSAEERRQVVIHELAHVRRFDCATQFAAALTVALHWFNPLAWYAQRMSRVAREQACDDAVLSAGGMPSTYASLLLAAAAPEGGLWMPAEAQAMARRSQIGERLLAVLDPARRRNPVDRRAVGWISATALAAAIPVVSIGTRPVAVPQALPAVSLKPATDTPPVNEVVRTQARTPTADRATSSTNARASISSRTTVSTGGQTPMPDRGTRSAVFVNDGDGSDICDPTRKGTRKSHSNSSASYSNDGGDSGSKWYSLTWTGPDCSVSIKSRGTVRFTAAEDDVAGISGNGRFEIQYEDGSIDRNYLVTSKGGSLERRYRQDDKDAELDKDALTWRAAMILEFIRRTGYDAEARAARIRKSGGVDALAREIGAINSDGVRSIYLRVALLDPSTNAADAAKLLTLTQGIGSDGDRSMVLAATPVALLSDESVQKAYADGANGIGSDGDLSRVLVTAITSGKLTDRSCEWVLGLVGHIGSDGDRSMVLRTATDNLKWNSSCVRRALELTRDIGSDGDKSATLIRFLDQHGLPGDLIPVFFQTTATIGSDGDHASVLRRVIQLDNTTDAVIEGMLEDSRRIGSDGDHSGVLVAAARRGLVKSERLRSLYRDSARGIGSDGDRDAAMRALERS